MKKDRILLLALLLTLCSCLKPSDLDQLEDYARTDLHPNMIQYSRLELKKWWDNHYKVQAMVILANGKAFDSSLTLLPKFGRIETRSSHELLNQLIKSYELNLSLRTLDQQSGVLINDWQAICDDKTVPVQLNLRTKISAHYLRSLKLPEMTETYMIGGGTGEDGLSMAVQSFITTFGTLFDHSKAEGIKKKAKTIKKLFREKVPSLDELSLISKESCLASVMEQKEVFQMLQAFHGQMKKTVNEEWKNYLGQKTLVGKVLLERKVLELKEGDKELEKKLGLVALNNLKSNLGVMRTHLLSLIKKYKDQKTIVSKEEVEDFIKSFETQTLILKSTTNDEVQRLAEANLKFLTDARRSFL